MKKTIWSIIIAVIVLIVGVVGYQVYTAYQLMQPQDALWDDYQVKQYEIEDRAYNLIMADTPERMQKGLMFVDEPVDGVDGMVFEFGTLEKRTFWNMNTYLPLDILWLRDGAVIGKSDLPSINDTQTPVTVSSPAEADTVIELFKRP